MNQGNQVQTVETFADYVYGTAAAAVTDPISTGLLHTLQVTPDLPRRWIWLATGAYYQVNGDRWFLQGRLNFYLGGQQTGFFQFSDASAVVNSADQLLAPRRITRFKPDSSGSRQPVIRYQITNGATSLDRDNLDMGAFEFYVECDRIEYHLEKSYYNLAGGSYLRWLTGFRVCSTR